MYQKFQASQIFTGTQLLEGRPKGGSMHEGFTPVLITKEDGTIENIVSLEDAGDDIQKFDGIISPGFINAHCHLELSHMKGMIPPKTGLQEFVKQIVGLRKVEDEIIQEAIIVAENEMFENGIVAVGDICNTLDTLSAKSKHRLAYYSFVELYDLDPTRAQDKINAGIILQNTFEQNCIRASLVPHAPYSCTFELLKLLSKFFGSHTISIHNQETAAENEFFEKKTGDFISMYERTKVSLDYFHATGKTSLQSVLPKINTASHCILVHNSFTSAADIDAVQQQMSNTFWCLCPNANQYIESAMPPIDLLRAQNANIVVGTDSYASNWSLNILDELITIQKHHPNIALDEMLGWATINGARALQMDKHLGSFEKGKKPGIVFISGVDAEGRLSSNSLSKQLITI
jgi:cytosine/adenosine deaminase-related metal-dependent hydrolase